MAALQAHGRTSAAVAVHGFMAIGNLSSDSRENCRRVVEAGACEGECMDVKLLS